jgi:hypothetical protein
MFGMAEELDEPRPASCDKPGGQMSAVKVDSFADKPSHLQATAADELEELGRKMVSYGRCGKALSHGCRWMVA